MDPKTKITAPTYTGIRLPNSEPVDILFINLTNLAGNPVYPYAFVQVSALARRAGLSVVRWDGLGLSRPHQLECITKLIQDHRPRVVAFTIRQTDSLMAFEYIGPDPKSSPKNAWFPAEDTRAAIEHVRRLTDAKIIVGGITFSSNPVSAVEYFQPDYAVIGEPDEFLAKFDQVIKEGRTDGVSNLLYRADGQWRQNERVFWGPLDDIEYTPDIIDEIFRFHGERALRNTHLANFPGGIDVSGHSIAIEIARGCPFTCTYCSEHLVKGRTVHTRNLDVIESEIHNLLRYGLRYYWFVCSELNVNKDHVIKLAERVIRINETLPRPIIWRANFLPFQFSKDDLRLLMRSGLLVEQNEPFTDLSDETMKQMRSPYRAQNALQLVKDLSELNKEPEFQARQRLGWFLWAWPTNPYSTPDSVRETLEKFSEEKLDLMYDQSWGPPALRVFECLDVPAQMKEQAIIFTRDSATPKSLIQPAYYFSHELVKQLGDLDRLRAFVAYLRMTLLSRYYRMTRNWRYFARCLEASQLEEVVASLKGVDLEAIPMPPWVEHPEMGEINPIHWRKPASMFLRRAMASSALAIANHPGGIAQELLTQTDRLARETERGAFVANVILGCLLHAAFSVNRRDMAGIFEKFQLPIDAEGFPPVSPYRTLSTLLRFHTTEAAALEVVKKEFSSKQFTLFRYYLYALDIRLDPEYAFLARKSQ